MQTNHHSLISLCVLLLLPILTLTAQDSLSYFLAYGDTPSRNNFHVSLADDQGRQCEIPVSVIRGKESGPVFTIIAGVHGYEYPPIIAAQELIRKIKPAELRGTVIIIPLLNPAAFYGRSPFFNPQDQRNLNRIFPGDENGTITERIAAYVTNTVIAKSDVVLDVHGGDANEDLLPFVCYYNNENSREASRQAKKLSESSGFKYVVSYGYRLRDDEPAKYLFKQAVQDGKTGLSIECGKLGNVQPQAVAAIKSGVYRMLQEMGMYPEEKDEDVEIVRLTQQSYLKATMRGIFSSRFVSGNQVVKGETIGQIKNAFGEVLTEVVAPDSGIILYKIGTPPVNVGETVMCLGRQ